jgi:hypothetical protein
MHVVNPLYESDPKSGNRITLSTTPYETEADGYLWIYMIAPNTIYDVSIKTKDDIQVAALRGQTVTSYEYYSIYVKKGMKIYCESDQSFSNDEQVYFTPLID